VAAIGDAAALVRDGEWDRLFAAACS